MILFHHLVAKQSTLSNLISTAYNVEEKVEDGICERYMHHKIDMVNSQNNFKLKLFFSCKSTPAKKPATSKTTKIVKIAGYPQRLAIHIRRQAASHAMKNKESVKHLFKYNFDSDFMLICLFFYLQLFF